MTLKFSAKFLSRMPVFITLAKFLAINFFIALIENFHSLNLSCKQMKFISEHNDAFADVRYETRWLTR